jgi:hypothetical protein
MGLWSDTQLRLIHDQITHFATSTLRFKKLAFSANAVVPESGMLEAGRIQSAAILGNQ